MAKIIYKSKSIYSLEKIFQTLDHLVYKDPNV